MHVCKCNDAMYKKHTHVCTCHIYNTDVHIHTYIHTYKHIYIYCMHISYREHVYDLHFACVHTCSMLPSASGMKLL